jgi:hypothetical protein
MGRNEGKYHGRPDSDVSQYISDSSGPCTVALESSYVLSRLNRTLCVPRCIGRVLSHKEAICLVNVA